MGVEQKLSSLQKTFPFAEVARRGERILVKHKPNSAGVKTERPVLSLAKQVHEAGGGFDSIFFTNRPSARRITDPSDQLETNYFASIITNDGNVHQIGTADPGFQRELMMVAGEATANGAIAFIDGFIDFDENNRVNYFITPPDEAGEKSTAQAHWKGLFDRMFWNWPGGIQEDIDVILSLADPTDAENHDNVVTASYRDQSLSIVLDPQTAQKLIDDMKHPYRGAVSYYDIRSTQGLSPMLKTPLSKF